MTWVYFLKRKSEVFEKFLTFYQMINTQYQTKLQVLRTDNGTEYINPQFQQFFQDNGLVHQTTCPDTPQQNGVAERKNRILLEITRAIMIESNVPTTYWPEAIATANYLINRLPTKILKYQTPLNTLAKYRYLFISSYLLVSSDAQFMSISQKPNAENLIHVL